MVTKMRLEFARRYTREIILGYRAGYAAVPPMQKRA